MYRVKERRGKVNNVYDGLVGGASPDDLLDNLKWLVSSIGLVVCLLILMPDVLVGRSPVLLVCVFGLLNINNDEEAGLSTSALLSICSAPSCYPTRFQCGT